MVARTLAALALGGKLIANVGRDPAVCSCFSGENLMQLGVGSPATQERVVFLCSAVLVANGAQKGTYEKDSVCELAWFIASQFCCLEIAQSK